MPSLSIDTHSQERDKTHQIFLPAHPSSLYDMRHRPSAEREETPRLSLGWMDRQSTRLERKIGDTPRRALLAEVRVHSISPPLRLPCVWTSCYEGGAETEHVTAGARVLRNDVQRRGARGIHAQIWIWRCTLRPSPPCVCVCSACAPSGTKGNAQGRRRGKGQEAETAGRQEEQLSCIHAPHMSRCRGRKRARRGRGGKASATTRRRVLCAAVLSSVRTRGGVSEPG
jgi:hypothetical protein